MMKTTSISQIKNKAGEFSKQRLNWHFHILTPECTLNATDKYAFVLECENLESPLVCYSRKPYMEAGKLLVQLLHGDNILAANRLDNEKEPSDTVKHILERASHLNSLGKSWHHHLLYPKCQFNQNKGLWTIIFEDKERDQILEAVYTHEPKSDLNLIETQFYAQKKAE